MDVQQEQVCLYHVATYVIVHCISQVNPSEMLPASCSSEAAMGVEIVEGISRFLPELPDDREALNQYPKVRPLQAWIYTW